MNERERGPVERAEVGNLLWGLILRLWMKGVWEDMGGRLDGGDCWSGTERPRYGARTTKNG